MVYKIEVFIPEEYVEILRESVNLAGACRIGNYDNVLSFSAISGYWRPLENSSPVTGEKGKINSGSEMKVEFVCPEENIGKMLYAVRKIHPYEEPVINIIPTANHMFENY